MKMSQSIDFSSHNLHYLYSLYAVNSSQKSFSSEQKLVDWNKNSQIIITKNNNKPVFPGLYYGDQRYKVFTLLKWIKTKQEHHHCQTKESYKKNKRAIWFYLTFECNDSGLTTRIPKSMQKIFGLVTGSLAQLN